MNEQIRRGEGRLVAGKTVISQEDHSTSSGTSLFRAARARGVNKTVYHWYGVTEYWMDGVKAQQFIRSMEQNKGWTNFVPSFAGARLISKALMSTMIQSAKQAAAPGRGIIAYQRMVLGTSTSSMAFASQ